MPPIKEGKPAPDFELKDQHGKTHRLSDYRGKPVVLFFYPKDMTTGCTLEANEFEELLPKFKRRGVKVLALSILGEKSKKKFAEQEGLTYPLLADDRLNENRKADPEVCQRYGVWTKKQMYGKDYMGIARTTYLIDKDGKVAKRWDVKEVQGHAAEVLEAAKTLG